MPSTMTTKGADKKTAAADGVGAGKKMESTYEKGTQFKEEAAVKPKENGQSKTSAQSKASAAFQRRIDKSKIPTCKILGVDIAAIDMNWLLKYTNKNLEKLRG